MPHLRAFALSSILAITLAVTAGCSLGGGTSDEPGGSASRTVVVASHDSWNMSKDVLARFTEETGYRVKVEPNGDAGQLTNKLVLTKGSPIADVVYGIDNTFASRAVDEGVLVDYAPKAEPASAASYALDDATDAGQLTPVDFGDVCVNVDDVWFREHGKTPPRTLDDLTKPAYKGLFVTPGATSSSPGLAFLLATIAKYGDGWPAYWKRLMANDTKLTSGWTDAYEVDFTAGGGHGDRPVVLSYASSPPFTIPKGASRPTTSSLPDTCFRQVEYAGVLKGARNPKGAKAFVAFMTQRPFQEALPESMYVFPVDDQASLPPEWARFAKVAPKPLTVPAAEIAKHRDEWLREWGDLTSR
jgi:thiamine transport system substrate-binding protein